MGRTLVCGDIHGAHKALLQCLERSGFNKEEDTLIQLGDVADGWNEVYECVEELLTIPNLISLKGNHDEWFDDFLKYGKQPQNWLQGGIGTLESYCLNATRLPPYTPHMGAYITSLNNTDIPKSHIEFFDKQQLFYIDDENRCFVHGGLDRHQFIAETLITKPHIFYWDRDLWNSALSYQGMIDHNTPISLNSKFKIKDDFKEIFIGHTTTMNWSTYDNIPREGILQAIGKKSIDYPMKAANIWNLDTGAGFRGRLTFMDVNTKEYFQSDLVQDLYPDQRGRN